jgi:hypothetical protein
MVAATSVQYSTNKYLDLGDGFRDSTIGVELACELIFPQAQQNSKTIITETMFLPLIIFSDEQPNGLRYPRVGGMRQRRFDGTHFQPRNLPESAATPTRRVHAVLGGFLMPFADHRYPRPTSLQWKYLRSRNTQGVVFRKSTTKGRIGLGRVAADN